MESFEWAPCFVTDLIIVDEQHRHLVDVINRFGEFLMQPHGCSLDEIEIVFNELASYADYHFRAEEHLMNESGIDPTHILHHRDDHERFLQDVTYLHAGLSGSNGEEIKVLHNFLTNWLAYHILGTDQLMASLIRARTDGTSQEEAYLTHQKGKDPATATLLHAMKRLFDQVSERNRELFELNQTLEARVVERTQELSFANERLENMALTDVLTGLPNRRHALLVLEAEWLKSLQTGYPLACMMIDADGFKVINDSFGHDAGDEVLRQLAYKLKESVRTDDIV